MTWIDMGDQRDAEGNLTDLALALHALSDVGCDCGTDEVGTCVSCLCEQALKGLYEQLESAKAEVERLKCEHAQWENEMLKELFTWADNWLSDEAKDQGARAVLQRVRASLAGS